jgi:hypothetical protein
MLMQEKETAYKGGIMAFVHTYFTGRFSNLSEATKWDLVRSRTLRAKRSSPDGAV